jgi:hypothetical protein
MIPLVKQCGDKPQLGCFGASPTRPTSRQPVRTHDGTQISGMFPVDRRTAGQAMGALERARWRTPSDRVGALMARDNQNQYLGSYPALGKAKLCVPCSPGIRPVTSVVADAGRKARAGNLSGLKVAISASLALFPRRETVFRGAPLWLLSFEHWLQTFAATRALLLKPGELT